MASGAGKIVRGVSLLAIIVVVVCVLIIAIPNLVAVLGSRSSIHDVQGAQQVAESDGQYDCLLVLGAAVYPNGRPSSILQDRLDTAYDAYQAGIAPKIIVSGDDKSDSSYNEVKVMKQYLVDRGIPSEDIFCDHAGMNTYDSMYRAKNVFGVQRIAVVTQTYHLYRALFDARGLGMDSIGVESDVRSYANQDYYDLREVGARVSDAWKILRKAHSEYLSEPVSLDQSGDVTDW